MTVTTPLYAILTELQHVDLPAEDQAALQPYFDSLGKQVIEMPEEVIARMRELHAEHQ